MRTVRWSDPVAWPDGKVPGAGAEVTIGRDMDVVLDVDPPALRSLTIDGKLSFRDDRDIGLETEWIYLRGGELEVGSEAHPYTHNASITLTDTVPNEDINTMGDRGILLMGGTLNLHGDREHTWTKLADTAAAGSTEIEVLDASGWRRGDQIVLASTDFNPRQAEQRTVTAVRGNKLTLDRALEYMHFGKITTASTSAARSAADAQHPHPGLGRRRAVLLRRAYHGDGGLKDVRLGRRAVAHGQHLHLARYPIHWHIIGEGQGQYIRNSAIHDTYSRCVTVHGTNNLQVENNVTFNTVGHCFFLEDAVETGNQFVHNLAIQTKCHPTLPCEPTNLTIAHQSNAGQRSDHILIPSDNTASSFWITNPDNVYRDNVAAGSDAIGFWIALPQHPTGRASWTREGSANIWPRRMRLREFSGNTAHSNFDALMFDRGPNPDGTFNVGGAGHIAYNDPADPSSGAMPSVSRELYRLQEPQRRHLGPWRVPPVHQPAGWPTTPSASPMRRAAMAWRPIRHGFRTSLFVGESDNIGNPTTPAEIAYGRTLPHLDADFPIRGYEYYDYRHDVVNTTFVNYADNPTRDAGAMSYLLFTSFGMSTENSVEGARFVNAKPVYFPAMQRRWSSDFSGRAAYRSATIHDLDGSVGGIPGAYIVIDNGIASSEDGCEIRSSWNAAICRGDMGRLSIGDTRQFPEFATGPATDPVVLQRSGKRFEYNGETTIPSGAEVRVSTARDSLSLHLREMTRMPS
jgi:cell migration-inducing and hyaluronan-binding protein